MYIYDNSNPHNPTYMSQFEHAEVCDPVFIEGNFAYVTLRSGSRCNGFQNQLDDFFQFTIGRHPVMQIANALIVRLI